MQLTIKDNQKTNANTTLVLQIRSLVSSSSVMLSPTVHLKRKVVELLVGARVSFVGCPVLKLLVEQSPEDNGFSRAMMVGFPEIHEPTCSIKDSGSEVVRIELVVDVVFLLTVSPNAPCLVNSTSHTLMDFLAHEASLDSIPEHVPGNLLGRVCIVLDVGISKVLLVKLPPRNVLRLVAANVVFLLLHTNHARIVGEAGALVKHQPHILLAVVSDDQPHNTSQDSSQTNVF